MTVALALTVAAATALVVRSAGKKVSRVQAAVSVAACRPHDAHTGARPRPGYRHVELEVEVAHLGRKPLSVDLRSLELTAADEESGAATAGGAPYRLVEVNELPWPTGQASGFTPGMRPRRVQMVFEVPGSFATGRLMYLGREVCAVSLSE